MGRVRKNEYAQVTPDGKGEGAHIKGKDVIGARRSRGGVREGNMQWRESW